jgi:hypothetical protein
LRNEVRVVEGELESKIAKVLSSPEDMAKIMQIAGSLGLNKSGDVSVERGVSEHDLSALENAFKNGKDERLELLSALKPFLKDGKRERMDTVLRLLNAAEILFSAKRYL